MKVDFSEIGQVDDKEIKFAVISAAYRNKWVFVKHKERDTWEIPGGHREIGENINDTAKRELFEETGAINFDIKPICDYAVVRDDVPSYGRLYYAEIEELGDLPYSEICEVKLFEVLPEALTYPQIQPYLHKRILEEI